MSGPVKSRRKYEDAPEVNYDPLRDIQGGKVELFLTRIGYYLRSNFKTVIVYLALFVFTVSSFIFYNVYRDKQEEDSIFAYEELIANPLMTPSGSEIDAAIKKLEKYESTYSSKYSALRSSLKKADIYVKAGKKQEAADSFLHLAEEVNDSNLEIYFYLKAAVLLEDTEQFERALNAYTAAESKIDKDHTENYAMALAAFGKGRNLILLGREKEGKEALKKMMAMKDIAGIEELRILAASFLIQHQK